MVRKGSNYWPIAKPSSKVSPWLALSAVLVAAFIDYLDVSISTAAVPTIQRELDASDAAAQWIVAGYTLPFALVLITGGRLGDMYGRKRMFMLGVTGFLVSSALCGLATGPSVLIGGRVLQGAAAAVMIPQVFAFIQVLFTADRRAGAFSAFAAVTGIASVAGAPLGALLIHFDLFGLSWRAVFLLNVPLGLVTLLAAGLLVKESDAPVPTRLDVRGLVVMTGGFLLLLFPLVQGAELGWPTWTVVAMAVGVVVLTVFVRMEQRIATSGRAPIVQMNLFGERSFTIGMIMLLVFFSGVNSFFFVAFLHLQQGLGRSIVNASLTIVSWPLAIAVVSTLTARWVQVHGLLLLRIGSLLMAVATIGTLAVISSARGDLAGWQLLPTLVLTGAGMGLIAPTLMGVILSGVPSRHAGSASGVLASTIQLGASVGIALAGLLFFSHLSTVSGASGPASTIAAALSDSARQEDFTQAIAYTLRFHIAAFTLTFLLALLLRKPEGNAGKTTEQRTSRDGVSS